MCLLCRVDVALFKQERLGQPYDPGSKISIVVVLGSSRQVEPDVSVSFFPMLFSIISSSSKKFH